MFKELINSKLFIKLMSINLMLVIVSFIFQIYKFKLGIENPTLIRIFDVNQELNIPTWYEGILMFYASILLWNISKAKTNLSKYWKVLATIFLFLSMDEVVSIHEDISMYVGNAIKATGIFYFAWVIVAIPFIIVLGIWLIPFFKQLPQRIFLYMFASAFIFVFGAIVVEMVGGQYAEVFTQHNLYFNLLSTIEELMELTGITLFIFALNQYSLTKHK